MGWIVAGNVTPSFIEGNSLTGEVCAGYYLYGTSWGEQSNSGLDQEIEAPLVIMSLSVFLFCLKVWFAWLVLNMETMFEEDSQLRRCVEHELLSNSACTPDQALKVHFRSAPTFSSSVQFTCAVTSNRVF